MRIQHQYIAETIIKNSRNPKSIKQFMDFIKKNYVCEEIKQIALRTDAEMQQKIEKATFK